MAKKRPDEESTADKHGNELSVGDNVEWTDPEDGSTRQYRVEKINGEILILVCGDDVCEAFGNECKKL